VKSVNVQLRVLCDLHTAFQKNMGEETLWNNNLNFVNFIMNVITVSEKPQKALVVYNHVNTAYTIVNNTLHFTRCCVIQVIYIQYKKFRNIIALKY
jgi:hypothetical protein